jgi:release factor glutamine methyltransferase
VPRSPDRLLGRTSVRDALDSAVIALTAAGCDTPRLDAELLLAAAMGVDRSAIVSDPGRELEPDAARRFMGYAARRREREPVAYILGRKGFRAIELEVDPRVLIPRPETEHLVEALLDLPQGSRVCDVGTGSGAIALALEHERPDLDVVATDASAEALDVARANARRLGLEVAFHHGDLLADVGPRLDAIVSNPPYVEDGAELAPDIVRYEPSLALRAGPGGLDLISRLLPAAGATEAHTVALEIGAGQSAAVAELMRGAGFPQVDVVADLAGIERVLVGRRPR